MPKDEICDCGGTQFEEVGPVRDERSGHLSHSYRQDYRCVSCGDVWTYDYDWCDGSGKDIKFYRRTR
jgi:hypothetical protein